MNLLLYLSDFILPLIIFYIILMAAVSKLDIYQIFLEGVKEGFHIVAQIMPTLVALMVSVGVLRASGIFECFLKGAKFLFANYITLDGDLILGSIAFPLVVLPLMIIRIFSSSAANGLLLDIFKQCGVDSLAGMISAISLSCTEALLYCISVYFASVGISKVRWTIWGALLSTVAGMVAAVILGNMMV